MAIVNTGDEEILFSIEEEGETVYRVIGNIRAGTVLTQVRGETFVNSTTLDGDDSVEMAKAILKWSERRATEKG